MFVYFTCWLNDIQDGLQSNKNTKSDQRTLFPYSKAKVSVSLLLLLPPQDHRQLQQSSLWISGWSMANSWPVWSFSWDGGKLDMELLSGLVPMSDEQDNFCLCPYFITLDTDALDIQPLFRIACTVTRFLGSCYGSCTNGFWSVICKWGCSDLQSCKERVLLPSLLSQRRIDKQSNPFASLVRCLLPGPFRHMSLLPVSFSLSQYLSIINEWLNFSLLECECSSEDDAEQPPFINYCSLISLLIGL